MGIFSQDKTTTNQTAYNQQTTASNRDLNGTQIQVGAGATNRTFITSLDEKALQTAAFTVNHAIDQTTASSQANLTGFQNALSVVAEHQQSAADLASGQQNSTLGQIGLSPQTIGVIAAVVGAVIIFGMYRHK